ncbi:hypothetical protein NQK81_28330 [Amycolatopsis roodepoortensis]|uniref:hypothetical protein n=1 Tax=Amycolatopsis roodepoortensis TaxID=700274 RepID=UPI00214CC8A9|nr:hypothetical protein [Amycolatopsis roodepoortensis]UUV28678.1 hypothetical protein NQK81_28330 [Amycolatopsis roodepoortensis]
MNPASRPSRSWTRWGAGATGVAACAVCCAGPLLAVLGGIGAASALTAIWLPAFAVLALLSVPAIIVVRRRRRASACGGDTGPVALGLPAVPGDSAAIAARSDRPVAEHQTPDL